MGGALRWSTHLLEGPRRPHRHVMSSDEPACVVTVVWINRQIRGQADRPTDRP